MAPAKKGRGPGGRKKQDDNDFVGSGAPGGETFFRFTANRLATHFSEDKEYLHISDHEVQSARRYFNAVHPDRAGTIGRGALKEFMRDVGLEERLGPSFDALAKTAFDACSGNDAALNFQEFQQVYHMLGKRYPDLFVVSTDMDGKGASNFNLPKVTLQELYTETDNIYRQLEVAGRGVPCAHLSQLARIILCDIDPTTASHVDHESFKHAMQEAALEVADHTHVSREEFHVFAKSFVQHIKKYKQKNESSVPSHKRKGFTPGKHSKERRNSYVDSFTSTTLDGTRSTWDWWDPIRILASQDRADIEGTPLTLLEAARQTAAELKEVLTVGGIDVAAWGPDALSELAAQIERGECCLMQARRVGLVRVEEVCIVRVHGPDMKVLVEVSSKEPEESPDSSPQYENRAVTPEKAEESQRAIRLPGVRVSPYETVRVSLKRCMSSLLNLQEHNYQVSDGEFEVIEDLVGTDAFPGFKTLFRKHVVDASIISNDATFLARYGLPSGDEFILHTKSGEVKNWAWTNEEEDHNKDIRSETKDTERRSETKELTRQGSKAGGRSSLLGFKLSEPNIGWTMDNLKEKFKEHGVDPRPFGQGKAKTLENFVNELARGELALLARQTEPGLLLSVHLLHLRVKEPGGRMLVEVEQKLPDGKVFPLSRLPGQKRRPGENIWHCARRFAEQRLPVLEPQMTIRFKVEEIQDEARDSQVYPGIMTICTKHYVDAEVGGAPDQSHSIDEEHFNSLVSQLPDEALKVPFQKGVAA